MQEAEFAKAGYKDSAKMLSWVKPKGEHKRMMQRLLQTRAHLILCFRADAKIEMIKEDGKTKIVPKQSLIGLDGYIPITEKTVPFELTVSMLLTPDKPGIPHPIKLQEQHKPMFPLDRVIDEESGRRIMEWAKGSVAAPSADPAAAERAYISAREAADLEAYCSEQSIPVKGLLDAAKVQAVAQLPSFTRAKAWIDKQVAAREAASRG